MTPNSSDLAELETAELEVRLESAGCERFHARQVYRWIHKCGVTDFDRMTNLSRPLRG